jgi:NAD(P)-dependent dehydrogenase (short-subunit alcohol dehydrogenase family)
MAKKNTGFNFDNQTVLVTGGLGILGGLFARGFAEEGAKVAIWDINEDTDKIVAEKYVETDFCERIKGFAVDISDKVNIDLAFEETEKSLGTVSHLLNNAASKGSDVRAFMEGPDTFSMDVWESIMKVNVDAGFYIAQHVANRLQQQNMPGSITFVSSIYGVVAPNPNLYEGSEYLGGKINTPPVYSASKASVIGLMRYLAAYWGKSGIRVNCISPGGVYSGQNEAFISRYSERVPLNRMAEAEEMVGPALFLASSSASYVNGHNLVIDGGFSQW